MDYCAAAFRFFAAQELKREIPLRFNMDRKEIDRSARHEIWEVNTPKTVFDGMPALCHVLIAFGPDHAQVVRENNTRIQAEKPDVRIIGAATWDREGFSAMVTANTQITPEDALFFGNLQ